MLTDEFNLQHIKRQSSIALITAQLNSKIYLDVNKNNKKSSHNFSTMFNQKLILYTFDDALEVGYAAMNESTSLSSIIFNAPNFDSKSYFFAAFLCTSPKHASILSMIQPLA